MFPPPISISKNTELLRRFGMQTVSNYGELIERQLDMSGQLFIRNCLALQDLLARQGSVASLDEWAQATQEVLQCAGEMTHETLEAISAHNLELRRLAHKHAAEAQRFYSNSLKEFGATGADQLIDDQRTVRKLAA